MPREHLRHRDRPIRIAMLATLVAVIALFHFLVPTTSHGWHELHIVLRKLYFLPPVVAAVWFGLGGAIWTTLAVSGLFLAHAVLDWPGNYMEQANQGGELLGFWVVALLAGHLFDRQRTLLEGLATAHEETVDGLVAALDLREHNTGMHSHRVREYTLLLADRLRVDTRQRHDISYGALLHDIGKIAVPDHILLKPGRLTDEEWVEIRKHPGVGGNPGGGWHTIRSGGCRGVSGRAARGVGSSGGPVARCGCGRAGHGIVRRDCARDARAGVGP